MGKKKGGERKKEKGRGKKSPISALFSVTA